MTEGIDLQSLRVDNVGSMLRPAGLLTAIEQHAAGEISDDELHDEQDDAIKALVAKQEQLGFPVIVDGEFRRTTFMESFGAVAGFDQWAHRHAEARTSRQLSEKGFEKAQAPSSMILTPATETLKLQHNMPLSEYRFAQALTARPVKTTLIGPDRLYHAYDESQSRNVYEDSEAFLQDVVKVERKIVAELAEAGCAYVQVDAPGYTAYVDQESLVKMRRRGLDPEKVMQRTIHAENSVVSGFPGVTFGIHICRGNERSHWHREGAYDAIAEQLLTSLAHHRYLLEYDSERSGDFKPLRFVPRGKTVVLGLITTKTGKLETRDQLLRRIDEATRYVPIEQLAISPQCGFASSIEGNNISETEQWAKLDLVLRVADEVWGTVRRSEPALRRAQ